MIVRVNERYDLLKEVEQLRHSDMKSAAANKVNTYYEKQRQMLQTLRKKGKKVYPYFDKFFVVKVKFLLLLFASACDGDQLL